MVSINYATKEVSCKIVFYGPGLSGKTTNLQYVHEKVPSDTKGKLISLATDADRTLYFDFLPINIGSINGFAAKFQLYTVPGQVYYNATRKLVLRGADGLVFVADSQPDKMDENIESLNNLKENLDEYGYNLNEMPIVIQYNKQDLPGVLSVEEMHLSLNQAGWPEFRASATQGFGVFDTLKCILKMVLDKARKGGTAPATAASRAAAESPAAESRPAVPEAGSEEAPRQAALSPVTASPVEAVPVTSVSSVAASAQPSQPHGQPQAENPEVSYRSMPVKPREEPPALGRSAYRPFPGNTREDEVRMGAREPQPRQTGFIGESVGSEYTDKPQATESSPEIETEQHRPDPSESPRMAPSLKAEKPRRKRSFFKRLFGLK